MSQGQGPGTALDGQQCNKDQKDISTSRGFFPWRRKLFHCLRCLFLPLCLPWLQSLWNSMFAEWEPFHGLQQVRSLGRV